MTSGEGTEVEVVKIEELGDVVDLMLKFMHANPYPDLGSLNFEHLRRFADAAEKYQIYSAMAACAAHME